MEPKTLRVVSWNCNGALRQKLHLLETFQADLFVIQEAEDPNKWGGAYRDWPSSFLWRGTNRNRGLAIFARNGLSLKTLNWQDDGRELFLPCQVDSKFTLVGVWNKRNKGLGEPYIGQFWHYLNLNRHHFEKGNIAVIGDFNSNTRWDRPNRSWNHGDVVREFKNIDIRSLHHSQNNIAQGDEIEPTLYLLRNLKKPFHIDYAFAHQKLTPENIDFSIGEPEFWLKYSDHMPITFNLKLAD